MNKVKLMILSIMIMFIVNVSVFCVLVYNMRHIYVKDIGGSSVEEGTHESINIEKGEILIINKCDKK